jgi:hypothetical protein
MQRRPCAASTLQHITKDQKKSWKMNLNPFISLLHRPLHQHLCACPSDHVDARRGLAGGSPCTGHSQAVYGDQHGTGSLHERAWTDWDLLGQGSVLWQATCQRWPWSSTCSDRAAASHTPSQTWDPFHHALCKLVHMPCARSCTMDHACTLLYSGQDCLQPVPLLSTC